MADTYPVRQDPLPLIKTPSLPTTGQIGMKEVLGIQEPYMREKARLIPEIGAARGAVEEAKQAQQVIGAEGEAKAAKDFAAAEKGAMQQYQGKMEREPLPAFVPSKENAEDLAALFSMISVIGMLVGGGAKENAQASMSAMNGMLEGHQKGRADLYKKELSEFDKNFKSMVQKHAEFRKEMEDAVKLASTDKEGAMADAKLAATKAGSNIVKAMLDQGRLVDSYKLVEESMSLSEKAVEAEAKHRADAAKEAAAERRHTEALAHAEKMRALSEAHAEKMARMKGGAGGAPLSGMSPKELFEETAKAIANYAERPPALRDPQRNALLARARQINPAYNEAGYGDRDIAYRNWINPNGAGFKQIAAFTTVAGHLETLDKLGNALKNNDTQAINSAYNWFQTATGDPSVTNFNAAKQAVAAETIKAITGTAGALRDREEAAAIFGAVQSPAQLKGAISTVKELINSRLQTSQAMFEAGTGRANFNELLPPIVKQTFRAGKDAPQAAAPALTGAAAIPTGKTVSVDEERSRAKAAIAAGKDPDAVKARFKEKTGQEL